MRLGSIDAIVRDCDQESCCGTSIHTRGASCSDSGSLLSSSYKRTSTTLDGVSLRQCMIAELARLRRSEISTDPGDSGANLSKDLQDIFHSLAAFAYWRPVWAAMANEPRNSLNDDSRYSNPTRAIDNVIRAMAGQFQFTTTSNLLGIGPSDMREGDEIV